jgi:hypothetical protein
MLLTHNTPTRQKYLRFSKSRSTIKQHEQWKTKRKLIVEKGVWDEDDDFGGGGVPFHVQDDDATTRTNQTQIIPENESETYMERYNDGLNENSAKIKEESKRKEKGIVYSESAGDKESEEEEQKIVPLPPPPPLPSTENSIVNEDEAQVDDTTSTKQTSTSNEKESFHNKTTQIHATNSKHNIKHKNQQQPTQDESKPADTIFDDLLRGFTFAATFCALVICIYKFCVYACVKCGIFPDERVMRARLRRSRLKKKRAYGDSNVVPPLDTRKWAEWSAKRGRVNGGVWDSGFDDIENNVGSHDDGSEAGAIVFDNSGIEMAEWDDDGNNSGSEMELEFGEGDELEDKSHDERLFDADDGGKGVEKEADKFFENQSEKKEVSKEKTTMRKNASDRPEPKLKAALDEKIDEDDAPQLLFNASFDALDPPSGENGHSSEPHSNCIDSSSSSAAKEFLLEVTNSDHPDSDTNSNKLQDSDQQNDEVYNSFESADDRGYDEDADLLGLRSDSPPPLDLEEIEKNLVENMNNAKFY